MVVQIPSRLMGRAERLSLRRLRNPAAVDQIMADEAVTSLSSAGDILWPLADYQGTIRDLATYDSGLNQTSIANHLVYDSFGKLTSETNSSVDHLFGFTGAQRDEESGLQYHRARYYDPDTGRWLSEDPSGFTAGDPNLARMVSNNPVNLTDPSGLQQQSGSGSGSSTIHLPDDCGPQDGGIFAENERIFILPNEQLPIPMEIEERLNPRQRTHVFDPSVFGIDDPNAATPLEPPPMPNGGNGGGIIGGMINGVEVQIGGKTIKIKPVWKWPPGIEVEVPLGPGSRRDR